jgi:hypothetical protein
MKALNIVIIIFLSVKILFSQTPYSFFVAGHVYGVPGTSDLGVYYKLKQKFPYIQSRPEIKFGVFTGDIVGHPCVEAWDSVDADIEELGLPVYFSVGNHDMYDRILYEQRYGRTYYTFLFNNDLFIVLDPNLENWNISQPQLEMIDSALSINNFNNVFVFFHQVLWIENPIYDDLCPNSYEGKDDTINFYADVEPRFHNLPNNVYMFAGDVGATASSFNIFYDKYDNMHLIASGMGNGSEYENFLVVNVDSNKEVKIDVVCLNSESTYCCDDISSFDHYISTTETNTSNHEIFYENKYLHVVNLKNSTLTIYDLLGKAILKKKITSENESVYIGNLKDNIYIINVGSNSVNENYKIFIHN